MRPPPTADGAWSLALWAARVFAAAPAACGGVALRGPPGPARDRWLALMRESLGKTITVRRLPACVDEQRLLGGLSLSATLAAGRPVAERGVLAAVDGGVLVLAMAERLPVATAAQMCAVMDRGEVVVQRDGMAARHHSRFGVIALDEGIGEDERVPAALLDRLALWVDLSGLGLADCAAAPEPPLPDAALAAPLATVVADEQTIAALCAGALALGVGALRAPWLALQVAKTSAALAGHQRVDQDDIELAAQLVLAPRAVAAAEAVSKQGGAEPEATPPTGDGTGAGDADTAQSPPNSLASELQERVVDAAKAVLPEDVLAALSAAGARRRAGAPGGRVGHQQQSTRRGRPAGVRRGDPRAGQRLHLLATLRAAAPWQRLRRAARGDEGSAARLEIRRDDFRVVRFLQRSETLSLFVVDASGSTALHRLAEAKGAVELLLTDCYRRRDRVALIAFRGRGAELLLPPTRSLLRAKRSLAALPGGGGTPLASAIESAWRLAVGARRGGCEVVAVFLTDGRANIARDGGQDRTVARHDAAAAARVWRGAGINTVLVDSSPRPRREAENLAAELGARYLPLPFADAAGVSRAVQLVAR